MRIRAAAVCLALTAAPARAQDGGIGTLTFDGPGAGEQHSVAVQVFYLQLNSASSTVQSSLNLTCQIEAPDPALITWVIGPATKRHATLLVQDRSDPRKHSVFELVDAEVSGLQLDYVSAGGGSQSLEVTAGHLRINGQSIY